MTRMLALEVALLVSATMCNGTRAAFCTAAQVRSPPPSSTRSASAHLAVVPFVGCPADGQVGPVEPPKQESKRLAIPEELASKLAYYKAKEGAGVLGPRGWSCFETYGSNGSSLFLTPEPLNPKSFFAEPRRSISGPAIQYSGAVGDTSGRFEVARMAARVFPHLRPFVNKVIAEGLEPASDFPFGPYSADRLVYRSNRLVEFTTPGNATGLGTQSWVARGEGNITGFAMITAEENDLFHLSMRLPPALAALGPVIIRQAEREAAQPEP